MVSISELVDETGKFDKEIADLAQVSESTLRKLKHGDFVTRKTTWRVVKALNELLNRNLTLQDIEGLNYKQDS